MTGVDLSDPVVVDLIQRLYFSRVRWRISVEEHELDHDDVLQAVYTTIASRNRGRHPYDPKRSALPTYLYAVIGSTVENALDQQRRRRARGWGAVGAYEDAVLTASRGGRVRLASRHTRYQKGWSP